MKKKTNDYGFTLVELIIVIAIMAILTGLLIPQYFKFVEKSREASDKVMVQELVNAMQVLISDQDIDLNKGTTGYKIMSAAGSDELTVSPGLIEKFGYGSNGNGSVNTTKVSKLKSKLYQEGEVSLSLTAKDGVWKLSVIVPQG